MVKKSFIVFVILFCFTLVITCTPFDWDAHDGYYENEEYTENFKEMINGDVHPSQDWGFDRMSTRYSNPNSNQWSDTYNVPSTPTQEEIDEVTKIFSTNNRLNSLSINYSNFFVQQINKVEHTYIGYDQNNAMHSYVGCNHMDYLVAGESDHIYNFNAANGWTMLMENSSTNKFGFHNSGDNQTYYNYCIIEYNGSYYVGFDWENHMNGDIDRDFYYDDWIVKITPAISKNAKRIFAEDLGTTDDFDFNDVVFDVSILNGKATITLLAAGGTIPLYIESFEVHNLFNVSTKTMVNTYTKTKQPVTFTLNGWYNSIDEIPIKVNHGAFIYVLQSPVGKTPQKIAVPVGTPWPKERINIIEAYPNFSDYAKFLIPVDWYNNVNSSLVIN